MGKLKLRGKDLKKIGYAQGRAIGIAIQVMNEHHRNDHKAMVLKKLKEIHADPEAYLTHERYSPIADALVVKPKKVSDEIALNEEGLTYKAYGKEGIEEGAVSQIETALRLPVAVGGALMADAHHGYGLPIGGVLATEGAIIPYGVGVDIGCRMCLSVFAIPPSYINNNSKELKEMLKEHTRFGQTAFDRPMDDEVLARPEFKEIPAVKSLKEKARKQIGSSGSGNHFVEFGEVKITADDNQLGLPMGHYLGLLSHSGSRGLGANIARHYTKLAMDKCKLPQEAKHLAWLMLDTEEGMEYWLAMNLAGDYASACHHHIHHRVAKALGEQPLSRVENHHNFAWKEKGPHGQEWIVHRKGATPAGKGVLGVIPGSMTAPGFIVRGRGEVASLNSASHGAGRQMSRTKAKRNIKHSDFKRHLKTEGVELIGGGLDEAPFAYKDIHEVMAAQAALVDILGTFHPRIVRMD
jgi:tRNA-splicing ligase RtcB